MAKGYMNLTSRQLIAPVRLTKYEAQVIASFFIEYGESYGVNNKRRDKALGRVEMKIAEACAKA